MLYPAKEVISQKPQVYWCLNCIKRILQKQSLSHEFCSPGSDSPASMKRNLLTSSGVEVGYQGIPGRFVTKSLARMLIFLHSCICRHGKDTNATQWVLFQYKQRVYLIQHNHCVISTHWCYFTPGSRLSTSILLPGCAFQLSTMQNTVNWNNLGV